MSASRYSRKESETEWLPGKLEPAREGVYRRAGIWLHQFCGENITADGYAYWSGTAWSRSQPSPELAFDNRGRSSDYTPRCGDLFMWLGLKEKT